MPTTQLSNQTFSQFFSNSQYGSQTYSGCETERRIWAPNLFICGLSSNPTSRTPSTNQIIQAISILITSKPTNLALSQFFLLSFCTQSLPFMSFLLLPLFFFSSYFSPQNPPLLVCLPTPYIVFLQWDTNHHYFNNSHAFPLSLESQGIIIPLRILLKLVLDAQQHSVASSPKALTTLGYRLQLGQFFIGSSPSH